MMKLRWGAGAWAAAAAILAVAGCEAPAETTGPVDLPKEAEAVVEDLITAVKPCDAASQIAKSTMSKGNDPVEAYEVLKRAADYCRNSAQEVNKLKPPRGAEGELKKAFEDGMLVCLAAQTDRADAYDKVAVVLNGDSRPSAIVKSRQAMADADNALLMCVADMEDALHQAGGKLPQAWQGDTDEPSKKE